MEDKIQVMSLGDYVGVYKINLDDYELRVIREEASAGDVNGAFRNFMKKLPDDMEVLVDFRETFAFHDKSIWGCHYVGMGTALIPKKEDDSWTDNAELSRNDTER